jgi:hypothetical protein
MEASGGTCVLQVRADLEFGTSNIKGAPHTCIHARCSTETMIPVGSGALARELRVWESELVWTCIQMSFKFDILLQAERRKEGQEPE